MFLDGCGRLPADQLRIDPGENRNDNFHDWSAECHDKEVGVGRRESMNEPNSAKPRADVGGVGMFAYLLTPEPDLRTSIP